jgi:hypothetical protein
MKKSMRIILLACIAVISAFMISGCADMQMGFTFNKDGTVTAQKSITVNSSLVEKSKIEKAKEDDRKKGFEVKNTADGYSATKTYKDMTDVVNDGGNLWNPNENSNGVQMRKGLLYDYYSLDLFIKGQKYDIPKADYQANVPSYFSPNVRMNVWQYSAYRQKAEEQAQEMNRMADEAAKAAMNSLKMNVTLNTPYSVDATNADNKTNDGKTLSWNLKPAFMDNKDLTIQAQFKIYHENTIIGFAVAGVCLLILAIVLVIVGIVQKDNPTRRKIFFSIAILVLVAVTSFAAYAKYSLDNPPRLTVNDRIIGENAKDSKGKPLADTLKNQGKVSLNSLEQANGILNGKQIAGTVCAVSVTDEDGFLALINIDSKLFFEIYDAKDASVALVPYRYKTLNFRANATTSKNGRKYYSPVIFNMEIPDDDKISGDRDIGIWNGTKHTIPVYSLFKVDDNDKIIPGMLTSGRGLTPSHYQVPLNEQRNVNLANVLLNHMDSLKKDIKARNIILPNQE